MVPVDDPPSMIDEDGTVAVAIEGDPHLTSALDNRRSQQLRVRRPAPEVDVPPVGSIPDDDRPDAESLEQCGRDRRRRAVGAVDGERESVQRVAARQERAQVIQVGAREIGLREEHGFPTPRRP